MATAIVQLTETEVSKRKAINYLKGWIIGSSVKTGMKWSTTRKASSAEFDLGRKASEEVMYNRAENVTIIHIISNRLRHGRPHLGSLERDQAFTIKNGYQYEKFCAAITKVAGEGWLEVLTK